LTRLQGYVLNDAVALVEDAEDRDALGHRRDSTLTRGRGRRIRGSRRGGILLLGAFAARAQRQRDRQRCEDPPHAYLGIQGS
jgi:hypothetical protein